MSQGSLENVGHFIVSLCVIQSHGKLLLCELLLHVVVSLQTTGELLLCGVDGVLQHALLAVVLHVVALTTDALLSADALHVVALIADVLLQQQPCA